MADRAPTLNLGALSGVWASVYALRDRLEAAADREVIAEWRSVVEGLDLTDVIATVEQSAPAAGGDPAAAALRRRHLQQVTAAAVLARLTMVTRAPGWPALIAVLVAALRRARAAGQRAGHAVGDGSDDGLDDDGQDDDASGDDARDQVSAYDVAAAALKALAAVVARQLLAAVAGGSSTSALASLVATALSDGLVWTLTVTTALGVVFTTGMGTAYAARGVLQFDFVTAGDASVCATCADAEDANPYPAASVPFPPLHPNCRCSIEPAGSED
ncbi:hypothetical protein [Streptacidiphilus albus]|uniref:hypothetical protein n=1 Tax=Streptacidiphilus albus TaxID=105425 RepID=UPI00054B0139|nr:hypothetical protein [Streptacidiphilus albus]